MPFRQKKSQKKLDFVWLFYFQNNKSVKKIQNLASQKPIGSPACQDVCVQHSHADKLW